MAQIAELAYLAGFFDGEGCIHLSERPAYWLRKGEKIPYTGFFGSVRMSQNVREPLDLAQRLFGGNIRLRNHPGKDRKWDHYEWEAPRSRIVEMLSSLMPYLIVKKREAELAIPYFQSFAAGVRITSEVREMRRYAIQGVKLAKSECRTKEAA